MEKIILHHYHFETEFYLFLENRLPWNIFSLLLLMMINFIVITTTIIIILPTIIIILPNMASFIHYFFR